jgi:lysophospholipase L1-like esterase
MARVLLVLSVIALFALPGSACAETPHDRDREAVVFLGDSITQGWGDDFRGLFPGMKAANRGIGGDTTRGMLLRLADDCLALDPSGVVMLMGTNDLEEGAEPETIAANVKAIIAAIESKNPRTPIVVCQVFPSAADKKRPAEKIKKLNALVAEVRDILGTH